MDRSLGSANIRNFQFWTKRSSKPPNTPMHINAADEDIALRFNATRHGAARRSGAIGLAVLCICFGARADDASRGVVLPAPEAVAPGVVVPGAAMLSLGDDQDNRTVMLELALSPGKNTRTLSIHIPPFGWSGESEPYPDRQFPELSATLDGKPATILSQSHVTFAGQDITDKVAAAQLSPFAITATPPLVDPAPGAGASYTQLQSLGAITTDQDGNHLAQWRAGRDIAIPLDTAQHLRFNYKARPAFASVQRLDAAGTLFPLGDYCVTTDLLRHKLGGVPAGANFALEAFAIPVGIGTRPPTSLRVTLASWVGSAEAGFPSSPHLLRIFCGADHHPVMTGLAGIRHDAATGSDGVLRILVISPALSQ
jgi:hypothetical protein